MINSLKIQKWLNLSPLIKPNYSSTQLSFDWRDLLIVSLIAGLIGVVCYFGAQQIDPDVFSFQALNTWFEADPNRVLQNMTDHNSDHQRTSVHPLFSLIAFPPTYLLEKIWGVEALIAVRLVVAAIAALWGSGLFALFRIIGCQRLDAVLFTLLGTVSAAAIFWFVVPETYSFGSLSIVIGLIFAGLTEYWQFPQFAYIITGAITLSVTITNWMVGIFTSLVHFSWKRTIQISINTFFLVSLIWGVQKILFRSAEFFLGGREEGKYLLMQDSGGVFSILQSFIAHTIVMPTIQYGENIGPYFNRTDWPRMFTQTSTPGSASLWGAIAVGLWLALLGLGIWAILTVKQHCKFRQILGLAIAGQLLLHLVYGNETFLYSLHFLPLLLTLAAFSTLTKARPIALLLTLALVLTTGFNNIQQFEQVKAFIATHGSPRHQMQSQMQLRPSDPWPRGVGHVVLALPGSLEENKAYHEPGGSFSPSVGSFGVSVWLVDQDGQLQTTSDTVPLSEINQKLIESGDRLIPDIVTETAEYQTRWSVLSDHQWQLNLQAPVAADTQPVLMIRTVGPAGGPINSLDWTGQQLRINDRWNITLNSPPTSVHLGQEGSENWLTDNTPNDSWESEDGWGYARMELGTQGFWTMTIEDQMVPPPSELNLPETLSSLEFNLPDTQFIESLKAQLAHIMMGIVNQEPRPGDPTNYPLPWLRDGAYQIVAIARMGQPDVAKQLATDFATEDFFGGFGPEADAPGLALWALDEVSKTLQDSAYDQWLWSHIYRKAELILEMLTTEQTIRKPITAPLVPEVRDRLERDLVADPAQDGLIVGRMDHHRPLLYVNAVSYAGLVHAAEFAKRFNQPEAALRWRTQADQLQQAWEAAFQPPESNNERTYMSGLWPTWVASNLTEQFQQGLQSRWDRQRDAQGGFREIPLWTYFSIAEAHQWLLLNQPDKVWQTLAWFWNNQASSDLYTWWEGAGEENSSGRWERVYGWVNPPHVTPHYWTAAEMLLLQLDMLTYLDSSTTTPSLVIGAGIPAQWLAHPLELKGLVLGEHKVSWEWDGERLLVKILGSEVNVKLGNAFPEVTPVIVEYGDSNLLL